MSKYFIRYYRVAKQMPQTEWIARLYT